MIVNETQAKHENHLREVVPEDRLFWYDVSEGWDPLCRILSVPVADRPFPRNNSTEAAARTYREVSCAGVVGWSRAGCRGVAELDDRGKLRGRELIGVVRSAYKETKYTNASSK